MPLSERRLFCFGLGFSAEALVRRLPSGRWRIAGTCRSDGKREALTADGIEAYVFDRDRPLEDAADALAGTTHLLISAPPDREGDAVLRQHRHDIAAAAKDIRWAGYLSTTGVYGDTGGDEVDETAPLKPTSERSARRVAAEEDWHRLGRETGMPMHVFRLAGIYGPGRSALAQARSGEVRRVEKPGHKFSRIHVEDIARVLEASIAAPRAGAVYNVCDDLAAGPAEVNGYACELLGLAPPPVVPFDEAKAEMSAMALSFWNDNRRVCNARIKSELGVTLAYPTYREGLQALMAHEGSSHDS